MRAVITGFWAERSGRERVLLAALLTLGSLWGVYALVWQPLEAARAGHLARIDRDERAIARLAARPATEAAVPTALPDTRPISLVVSETVAGRPLAIRRIEPNGQGVRIVLDDADFDAVIAWLDAAERENGLRTTEIQMTRRPAPGSIATELALDR